MTLAAKHEFYLAEYRALREEIGSRLTARLQFTNWGLLALGAVYSYIFSNLDKPFLFFVPVVCSFFVVAFLACEYRMIQDIAKYIRDELEPRLADPKTGWETHRSEALGRSVFTWQPMPIWYAVCIGTTMIALAQYYGRAGCVG